MDNSYIAFIAYRHIAPDQAWAKWLQQELETFRLPGRLVKPGMPDRLGRVFRDHEEMSASPDLGDSIKTALKRSQWLVVVCSPRTHEAQWIDDEIREFRSTRSEYPPRVLTLLLEGDPNSSFPAALRSSDAGLSARQPAAADVRPMEGRRTRDLRRTALLKIAAALANVPYDALRERDEERSRRRRLRWTIGLGVTASGFLLLSLLAVYQWYQARSRERAALALNAVWRDPAAAKEFASEARCASRTSNESANAVAAVLRESNVVAVWSDQTLSPITAAGFSMDASQVIFSTAAGKGWIWNWTGCDATEFPNYPMLALRSTAMTQAAGLVVSQEKIGGAFHDLRLRPTGPGTADRSLHRASGSGAITTAAFSPDSRYLATGSFDTKVRIWQLDANDGPKWTFDVPKEPISSIRFNPRISGEASYEIVVAAHDGRARVWQFNDKGYAGPAELSASTTALLDATFSPTDPNVIIAAGQEGKVFLWERHGARWWWQSDHFIWIGGFEIREVSFSQDGAFIVTASADNIARVWDWRRAMTNRTAEPVRQLYGHRSAVTAAEFSPDGDFIVTASTDGTVRVWRNEGTAARLSDRRQSHACGLTAKDPRPRMASERSWADALASLGCFFRRPD